MFDSNILIECETKNLPILVINSIVEHGRQNGRNVLGLRLRTNGAKVGDDEFLPSKERSVETLARSEPSVKYLLISMTW